MASLTPISANIRLADANKKTFCSVNNVSAEVTADTAAAFVSAIETLRNAGPCKAQMRIVYDIES